MFIYIYCSYKTKENISDIHGSKRVEEWGSSVGVIAVFTDFPRIYTIIPQGVRKGAKDGSHNLPRYGPALVLHP